MIKSMTGFGSHRIDNENATVSVEVRTLNSKFLDTNIRLPELFISKEIEVKNIISKNLVRGKIGVTLSYNSKSDETQKIEVNNALAKDIHSELLNTAKSLHASETDIFRIVMSQPDVMTRTVNQDVIREDWLLIKECVIKACENCNEFRSQEGSSLNEKLTEYINKISALLEDLDNYTDERLTTIKERITNHMKEISGNDNFDKNRFEQEMIYYIEKLDVAEEQVRLKNHLSYFLETLESNEASGKKLGFISQEIGREINTLGSKANHVKIQRIVVNMKDELEKIKEQTLNIL